MSLACLVSIVTVEKWQSRPAVTASPSGTGTAVCRRGGELALLSDAFEKFVGGFVGRVLGDEATLESAI